MEKHRIRRDLFYLLDYVNRQSEKSRFEKKNWFSDKLVINFQILAHFCSPEKCYVVSLSNPLHL